MIQTSRQLKALVQNRSGKDSAKAQAIIRNYMMERFLERIALSKYKKHFILKGGMLVSAVVGLDHRSTMDMDATMKNLPLTTDDVEDILIDIIGIETEDNILFSIIRISEIMDEAEYPGVRAALEARLDTMRIPLKIDISTGDAITPGEIEFAYKLMFEDRTISIYAYNIETVLAEKLETVISRGTANTRLRDFYDLYILQQEVIVDYNKVEMALEATAKRRRSISVLQRGTEVLNQVFADKGMQNLWRNYQKKFDYATDVTWDMVMKAVVSLHKKIKLIKEIGELTKEQEHIQKLWNESRWEDLNGYLEGELTQKYLIEKTVHNLMNNRRPLTVWDNASHAFQFLELLKREKEAELAKETLDSNR